MPVIINEIDVMDHPAATAEPPASPAPSPAHDVGEAVRLALRDLADRQRRLVAD